MLSGSVFKKGSGMSDKSRRRVRRRLTGAVLLLWGLVLAGVTAMAIAEMREPAPQGALHARGP